VKEYSAEFHRTIWIHDITPPFEIFKRMDLLWHACVYVLAALMELKRVGKVGDEQVFKIEELKDKIANAYSNKNLVERYHKYMIHTSKKDFSSAYFLISTAAELNHIRDELVIIAKAVGLDKINIAVLENVIETHD